MKNTHLVMTTFVIVFPVVIAAWFSLSAFALYSIYDDPFHGLKWFSLIV
jgi:hypothetical protein